MNDMTASLGVPAPKAPVTRLPSPPTTMPLPQCGVCAPHGAKYRPNLASTLPFHPMRLLIVEDDTELASALASALAQSGYAADVAHAGGAALAACGTITFQLIVIDLGLPDMDGLEVLRRLRRGGISTPVLILTARDELRDRVIGLDSGADDYLVKPFEVAELEARIRALLRRGDPASATITFASLSFEPASRRLTVSGEDFELTASELAVLEILLRREGRIVSKRQIFDSLYNWDNEASLSMVEVFISRLRRKLSRAHAGVGVRVFRGLGYRLEAERERTDAR
jgi:DNA-binding response OmpR family regulator